MADELIGVADARTRVLACVEPLAPERVGLEDVLGRVVARYWPRPTWFGARPPSARSRA